MTQALAKIYPESQADLNTAAVLAASDGDFDRVFELLDSGADIHSRATWGVTLLHFAAALASMQTVEDLILIKAYARSLVVPLSSMRRLDF